MKSQIDTKRIMELKATGMTAVKIAETLKISVHAVRYHIKMENRKAIQAPESMVEKEFDLSLYCTVTRAGCWYRVTAINEDAGTFTVKRADGPVGSFPRESTVNIADYRAGKSGYRKRDLPPVTTYKIGEESKPSVAQASDTTIEERLFVNPSPVQPEDATELMPRIAWDQLRKRKLAAAVMRHIAEGTQIDIEWIKEYNELSTKGGSANEGN